MDISDLLVRHEKLVHLNEGGSKDGNRPRKPSSAGTQGGPSDSHVDTDMLGGLQQRAPPPPQQQPQPQQQQPHYAPEAMAGSVVSSLPPDPRLPPRAAPACNLDLLSDAATHLASAGEVNAMQPMLPELTQQAPAGMPRLKPYDEVMAYGERAREPDQGVLTSGFPG